MTNEMTNEMVNKIVEIYNRHEITCGEDIYQNDKVQDNISEIVAEIFDILEIEDTDITE